MASLSQGREWLKATRMLFVKVVLRVRLCPFHYLTGYCVPHSRLLRQRQHLIFDPGSVTSVKLTGYIFNPQIAV